MATNAAEWQVNNVNGVTLTWSTFSEDGLPPAARCPQLVRCLLQSLCTRFSLHGWCHQTAFMTHDPIFIVPIRSGQTHPAESFVGTEMECGADDGRVDHCSGT